MGKLKTSISNAFSKAQTMSDAEKKIQSLIIKQSFKKTIPHSIATLAILVAGMSFNINIFIVLAAEILLGYLMIKKARNVSTEFNNFTPYQGNIISIQSNDKGCNLVLKQGKKPIKMEIEHFGEDFKSIKKNEFVSIAYNKAKKIALIHT